MTAEQIQTKYNGRFNHEEFSDDELCEDHDIIYSNYRELYQHSSGLVRRLKEVQTELEKAMKNPVFHAARVASLNAMLEGLNMLNDDINSQIARFDSRLLEIGFKRCRINEIVQAVTWDY